jgi:hypothetical protein
VSDSRPSGSRVAGTPTSTAPTASPQSAKAAISTRTPGPRSAPSRWRSARGGGRQPREAGCSENSTSPISTVTAQASSAASSDQAPIAPTITTGPMM